MLKTKDVVRINKVAQHHGDIARAAVDQAAVVAAQHAGQAREYAKLGAQQVVLGAKVAGNYVAGFVGTFFRRGE